jgi:hypothetical protein
MNWKYVKEMIDAMCPPSKRTEQTRIYRRASNYKLTEL